MDATSLRLGVSACLVGQKVRYDGDSRRNLFVVETLAREFELVPVCPEAELGMGVPRETVDLVGSVDQPAMIGTHSRKDWTQAMNRWAQQRVNELAPLNLCGFVLKKGSPSCGVFRVPVIQPQGEILEQGRGLFAAIFMQINPEIPVEDELRLEDPVLRQQFLERVRELGKLRAQGR